MTTASTLTRPSGAPTGQPARPTRRHKSVGQVLRGVPVRILLGVLLFIMI